MLEQGNLQDFHFKIPLRVKDLLGDRKDFSLQPKGGYGRERTALRTGRPQ